MIDRKRSRFQRALTTVCCATAAIAAVALGFFVVRTAATTYSMASTSARYDRALAALDFVPDRLLLSFHGMPQRTLRKGDPYHCHCRKTARLVGERMAIAVDTAFQSRFGRDKWLEPSTENVLAAYPAQGVKKLAIAAPGFSADCIETIEELGIRGRESFEEAGGTHFARLDCLNASDEGMTMLSRILSRELAGWVEPA